MTISPLVKAFAILLILLQFSSIGLLLLLEPIFSTGILLLVQLFGIGVGLAGVFALRLGEFNIVPILKDDCRLYTSGIYHYIRHPMYASIFLFCTPALLQTTSFNSLLVFAVLTITLLVKIHLEEHLLQQKFAEYELYKTRSKKLIPYIF